MHDSASIAVASSRARSVRLEACATGWRGLFDAMASPCEVHVATGTRARAHEIADAVAAEAWRIERKYGRYVAGNVVHAINSARGRTIGVDAETARLLDYADSLYAASAGRFDITAGVLRRAWRCDGRDQLPSVQAVHGLLAKVGWSRVRWDSPARSLRLEPGMEVDFGGIGKAYAVDCAVALVANGEAACLINFGGDLRATAPPAPGRPWRVGIEALDGFGSRARLLELERSALATSGDARHFPHHLCCGHVLDARTGLPVADAPRSVTVAAPTCSQAAIFATLALLHGARAEQFLRGQGVAYWCSR